jgi:hypothetical protein
MHWWRRITLADVAWEDLPDHPGVSIRSLGESSDHGPPVMHVRFAPNYVEAPHWHSVDTFYVITAGEFVVGEEGIYRIGDIRWVRAGTFYGPETAGPDGCEFLLAGLSRDTFDLSYDRSTAAQVGSLG